MLHKMAQIRMAKLQLRGARPFSLADEEMLVY